MMIVRFRNKEDHKELLRKVKKMKKFTEELEDCLEEAMYDEDYDEDYRDDDEYEEMHRGHEGGSRYKYRRGGGSRGGRM